MDIEYDKVKPIAQLLLVKATRRSAIRYSSIYKFFSPNTKKSTVWETFEKACNELATPSVAIYGVLMAEKDTDLPSTGFYDVYRNVRREEYLKITGGQNLQANQLSRYQMEQIAQDERLRVHRHATQINK